MTKIELTISPDYVPNWTVVDAVRELFQNAIDQQEQYSDNKMSWEYDRTTSELSISNKLSKLTIGSLLLGTTTKSGDPRTIGHFGEGYKIATLVLLRNNKNITFFNHKANEIWKPRLVESRRFGTKVLTFFIEKCPIWKWNTENDLTIKIEDIDNEYFDNEIAVSNLYINGADIIESTQYGDILKDMQGGVFVNGLFVCNYQPYQYGYNFKPSYISLDRDRKMASDFDLKWLASRIWAASKQQGKIIRLIEKGAADVEYIGNHIYSNTCNKNSLYDALFASFLAKYGENAIPVSCQEELDTLPSKYRGVMVSYQYKSMISNSNNYVSPKYNIIMTPLDELNAWFEKVYTKLEEEEQEEFKRIYNKLI